MNKRIFALIGLSIFAMMQISACFVAGMKTEGFLSVFYFFLGGVSCLFGLALNFLLLIIAVDVFGSIYGSLAHALAKKQAGEEEDDEEMEIIDTPEDE
jgi:hypothetical protein